MRIAAIEVSHWHSLYDSAYLRHLAAMPDVQLVGVQDPSAEVAAQRAAALGGPPVFTDYMRMLAETKPDFVVALGRHSTMADTAHYLLDAGYPFLMEKPMGINADQVRRLADKAAAKGAFVAVPLAQRYQPFTARARQLLAETRPDFVVALGRHSGMADTAHFLLDAGYPFLMEKPMGINADQVRRLADKAAAKGAFVAVPLAQRYQPFTARARQLLAEGRFGPLSHIYFRLNRPTSARYRAWGSPWMLDPAVAGGGCLRNLGPHGFDLFLFLTGEHARVTGAQLSRAALGQRVEDYASVLVRSTSGVLGTIEVGNGFPRDGTDGEWKIAGRDAIFTMKDDTLRLVTRSGEETAPGQAPEPIALTALRDALDHWRRGEPPPISVADCARVAVLIDQAYELAGGAAG